MKKKQWYETMFENYAESYDKEEYTHGTAGEVDFIEKEIGHDTSVKILDVGCGTGRHAVELAQRGYRVTGVDLSADQLKKAREKAEKAGLTNRLRFVQGDARDFDLGHDYGLVIMMCEGAFPLMETDEMNFQILENTAKSLKPGGRLIFTSMSVLYPLFHSVKDFMEEHGFESRDHLFDLMTFRESSILEMPDDSGNIRTLNCNDRYYAPSEITWLLKSLGFRQVDIYGCDTGKFSRETPLTPNHFEMLVIAQK